MQNPSAVYSKQDFTNKNITLNNSGYTQQYLTKTHGKHEGLNTHKTNDWTRHTCAQWNNEPIRTWHDKGSIKHDGKGITWQDRDMTVTRNMK